MGKVVVDAFEDRGQHRSRRERHARKCVEERPARARRANAAEAGQQTRHSEHEGHGEEDDHALLAQRRWKPGHAPPLGAPMECPLHGLPAHAHDPDRQQGERVQGEHDRGCDDRESGAHRRDSRPAADQEPDRDEHRPDDSQRDPPEPERNFEKPVPGVERRTHGSPSCAMKIAYPSQSSRAIAARVPPARTSAAVRTSRAMMVGHHGERHVPEILGHGDKRLRRDAPLLEPRATPNLS